MVKKVKIPKRVQTIAERMKRGEVLCMSIRHSEVGDERQYWLEPSGKSAGEWTVQRALDLGLIEPVGDGLFPDADSQTYRAAQ